MKEATGEMTTTVIVIVGLVGVLALGTFIWGKISETIETSTDDITSEEWYTPAT